MPLFKDFGPFSKVAQIVTSTLYTQSFPTQTFTNFLIAKTPLLEKKKVFVHMHSYQNFLITIPWTVSTYMGQVDIN